MHDFLQGLPADFDPVELANLPGLGQDDLSECWPAFLASCERTLKDSNVLRPALGEPAGARRAAAAALAMRNPSTDDVRGYFAEYFSAFLIRPRAGQNPHPHGFVTGYYEPEAPASLQRAPGFEEPVRGLPPDLLRLSLQQGDVTYAGARIAETGEIVPYWSRAEIDHGLSSAPVLAWVRDAIELFMIQVQGSARLVLPDGRRMRLVYAGRNGRPYESIGRILVSEGHMKLADMSLDSLKDWVRQAGQSPDGRGRRLLHRNPSYIFFELIGDIDPARGPIGGEGVPLTRLRSLAIDRAIWPYGLPFWVSGRLPAEGGGMKDFHRLLIAQDTGSAIVGAARGDIFFGSGDAAGQLAARVRHEVEMFVFLPKG